MPAPTPAPKPEPQVQPDKMAQIKDASTKTFAVFGIIAVLGLLSYGVIKIAPAVIRSIASAAVSLSSVFIPAEKLSVSSDKYTVGSGEVFNVSWSREAKATGEGSYTLSYLCSADTHLEAVSPAGNTIIFCNTSFHFLNENNNKLSLVAFSKKSGQTEIPLTIHFIKNGESSETTQGTITIVTTGNTINPPVAPTTTTPVVTAPRPNQTQNSVYLIPGTGVNSISNPNGFVDLTARILETGYTSTTTGAFVAVKELRRDQRPAIRFEIVNNGTRTSKEWTFAAVLPTYPDYIFQSTSFQGLAPGDRMQFTLAFDSMKQQAENNLIINVDPLGSIMESNRDNNIIKGKIYLNLGL